MQNRLEHWLDVVRDLLAQPLTEMPHVTLLDELVRTFGGAAGSWIDRQPDGHVEHHLWESGITVDQDTLAWLRNRLDQHPLPCWFAATEDLTAYTLGRVPRSLRDPRFETWNEVLGGLDLEHQMAIPLSVRGVWHRAFVIVLSGSDATDEDLRLARRLQALLIGLDRQARALARWMPRTPSHDAALTNQEVAVLGFLAQGLTARAVARRLLISPRTVQKHVEHIHAKLRVTNRVSAVLKAQALGVLTPPPGYAVASSRPSSP
ncbi:response regulator transcription factor [Umezawaea sp.]|uniref:response regulator transcription factor n=1 Tax=Umezawaea sp. TaxID=1955258 RepID=UPI002ED61B1B